MTAGASPDRTLSGTTALITGGTSGIGRAAAIALAGLGSSVAVSGRDAERGAKAVAAIEQSGGLACFVPADLRDEASARALARAAADRLGRVDSLVNNAGIFP
ncbi:MAG: SDR family NAD(P)-dependent oxidoreductase, partial [Catenulispora sp.]